MRVHTHTPTYNTTHRPAGAAGGPGPAGESGIQVDNGGGGAAALITTVVAGGARSFARMGSETFGYGAGAFIGATIGVQMANSLEKSPALGLVIGAGVGAGVAAAGVHGGWPGVLGAAALAYVVRGVVVPSML